MKQALGGLSLGSFANWKRPRFVVPWVFPGADSKGAKGSKGKLAVWKSLVSSA